jgi:chemotaxis protein CheZ
MSATNNSPDGPETKEAPMSDFHQRIGLLTRQLHDSLNGLGLTEQLKDSVGELPDAKSRLAYIARLTGEAAEKVLNRVDQAKSLHDNMAVEARRIAEWVREDPVAAVRNGHVMNFVAHVEQATKAVDQHLTEIMMAQDFHDLTGQVIGHVVNLTATIEEQLIQLLIETAPPTLPQKSFSRKNHDTLSGPVVSPLGNPEVVTNQTQVDDLLASLGF